MKYSSFLLISLIFVLPINKTQAAKTKQSRIKELKDGRTIKTTTIRESKNNTTTETVYKQVIASKKKNKQTIQEKAKKAVVACTKKERPSEPQLQRMCPSHGCYKRMNPNELVKHIQKDHTYGYEDESDCTCNVKGPYTTCGKVFRTKHLLKKHIENKHQQ